MAERALCRLSDLLDLSELVAQLMSRRSDDEPEKCKVKYTANVREIMPHTPWSLR